MRSPTARATICSRSSRAALAAARGCCSTATRRRCSAPSRRSDGASALCRAHGVPLIVNDDIALARRSAPTACIWANATTRSSPQRARARQRRDHRRRPATTRSTRARQLPAAGADYLAFGAFFPSPTKPGAARADRSAAAKRRARRAAGGDRRHHAGQCARR